MQSPSYYQNRIVDYNMFADYNHCLCDIHLSFNTVIKPLSTAGKWEKAEGLCAMKEITGGAHLRREGFLGER